MLILGLLGMYFDAVVVFVTFIQIGSGHTVRNCKKYQKDLPDYSDDLLSFSETILHVTILINRNYFDLSKSPWRAA